MSVKIGIALGGGGARGLAHAGVLKVLEEEGIPLHYITGTSIGAVVGAAYAQNPKADFLIERFEQSLDEAFYSQLGLSYLKTNDCQEGSFLHQTTENIKRRIAINLAQSRTGLLKEIRLKKILVRLIDQGHIEDTKIPLGVVATSLHTGDDIVFKSGDIIDAVAASSSIPGFLCPVCLSGDLITDGGVSCPVPVKYLPRTEVDVTIGVELSVRDFSRLESVNAIEIIGRADMITSRNFSRMMAGTADVAIFPDTKNIHWSEFSRAGELIEAGIESAREKLPEIKKAMKGKLPWYKRALSRSFIP
jgi:NTE family protein